MSAQRDERQTTRDKVALGVVAFCGIGILVTVVSAVWAASNASSLDNRYLVLVVVSALFPMFAACGGAALALYFGRENFNMREHFIQEVPSRPVDDQLRSLPIGKLGTPVIEAVEVEPCQECTFKFADVKAKLRDGVSRIPVWDAKRAVRYVIHESMIYRYLAEKPAAPAQPTLDDFLNFSVHGQSMRAIVSAVSWVSPDATSAVVRERMETIPNCEDVFVTAGGQSTQPVLRWITNIEMAKARL